MKQFVVLIGLGLLFFACDSKESTGVEEEVVTDVEKMEPELKEKEEVTIVGVYQLKDMIPVTNGKTLTKSDETYISDSKKRTIGHTELTINEDGTFKRVFPSPMNDGSISEWTGTYELTESDSSLMMKVNSNGKTMDINFKIMELTASKLSINTDFGQIFMTYVYEKK